MILMIRINLLPTKAGRKRRSGQRILAILGVLLVLEILALFVWYQAKSDESTEQYAAAQTAEARVKKLEEAKRALEERERAKMELARQNVVFEKMKDDKSGPPEMLKFLSYVLTKKEDNLYNREELKAQEAAGWSSGWDPGNLWIADLRETEGYVNIKGTARSHEDVAEFYRRLESGIYFLCIDPIVQSVTTDRDWPEVELVSFEAEAMVNYNADGELNMSPAEVPECLAKMIAAQEKAAADEAAEPPKAPGEGGGS